MPLIAYLRLIFALNKGRLDLLPFTKCSGLAMSPSCCFMSLFVIDVKLLSQFPMKLKQGFETPFMDVLLTFLPCSNRYLFLFLLVLSLIQTLFSQKCLLVGRPEHIILRLSIFSTIDQIDKPICAFQQPVRKCFLSHSLTCYCCSSKLILHSLIGRTSSKLS